MNSEDTGRTLIFPQALYKFPVTIYYWPAYEHYRSATEHVSVGLRVYTARIKVEPGIVYALRVGAYSAGGQGRKSPTTYFAVGKKIEIC
ncbi:protein roadkill [Elysia marginata]|uniref:Protein roadkill n=1 Tax=Elysia marginata TaxID=1093978 RepID=A0AAV4IND8_9GAST|nr:protein roadkill [Elysia marginata]